MPKKTQKPPKTGVKIEMTDGSFATVDEDNAGYMASKIWFPLQVNGNIHAARMAEASDGDDFKGKFVLMEHDVVRLMSPAARKAIEERSLAYEKEQERQAFLRHPLKKSLGGTA